MQVQTLNFLKNYWNPILIVLTGLLYIFIIPSEPVLLNISFKILPMLLIIYYGWTSRTKQDKKYEWLIFLGIFFCMLGDALLIYFVTGLSLFLIGHVFYSAAFYGKWQFSWWKFATFLPILVFAVTIGNELTFSLINSGQDQLLVPVMLYIIVISMMFWLSIMSGNLWAIMGALLFVGSDSILAWNKFVADVQFSHEIIMITYYSAQFLIMRSIVSGVIKNSKIRLEPPVILRDIENQEDHSGDIKIIDDPEVVENELITVEIENLNMETVVDVEETESTESIAQQDTSENQEVNVESVDLEDLENPEAVEASPNGAELESTGLEHSGDTEDENAPEVSQNEDNLENREVEENPENLADSELVENKSDKENVVDSNTAEVLEELGISDDEPADEKN